MNVIFFAGLEVFFLISIPAAIIDIRSFRIPNILTYSGCIILILLITFLNTSFLPEALIAAVLGFLFFNLIRRITKGLGLGDVKFAAFVRLFCGLRISFISYLIAAMTGMLVASILLITRKFTRKQPIPFATFLAFGAVAAKMGAFYIWK